MLFLKLQLVLESNNNQSSFVYFYTVFLSMFVILWFIHKENITFLIMLANYKKTGYFPKKMFKLKTKYRKKSFQTKTYIILLGMKPQFKQTLSLFGLMKTQTL